VVKRTLNDGRGCSVAENEDSDRIEAGSGQMEGDAATGWR
jgi:hypothetical protein